MQRQDAKKGTEDEKGVVFSSTVEFSSLLQAR
jgi:hypothetical protein